VLSSFDPGKRTGLQQERGKLMGFFSKGTRFLERAIEIITMVQVFLDSVKKTMIASLHLVKKLTERMAVASSTVSA